MIPTKPVTLFFFWPRRCSHWNTGLQYIPTCSQPMAISWRFIHCKCYQFICGVPCTLPLPDDCSSFPQKASSPHHCEAFWGLQLSFLFMDDNSYTVLLCSEFVFILGTFPTLPQYQCELMRQVQDWYKGTHRNQCPKERLENIYNIYKNSPEIVVVDR